jgi:hypothetical protein
MRQLGVPQPGVTGQDVRFRRAGLGAIRLGRELAHLQAIYDEHRKARHAALVAYKPDDDTPPTEHAVASAWLANHQDAGIEGVVAKRMTQPIGRGIAGGERSEAASLVRL